MPVWAFCGILRKPTELVPSAVQLLKLPDVGVPRSGVTNVGVVAKTNDPVPVSSETAAIKLAEDGVPKKVATPVPKEVRPVPPLVAAKVPATVTAPLVAVDGVKPVLPNEILATFAVDGLIN